MICCVMVYGVSFFVVSVLCLHVLNMFVWFDCGLMCGVGYLVWLCAFVCTCCFCLMWLRALIVIQCVVLSGLLFCVFVCNVCVCVCGVLF